MSKPTKHTRPQTSEDDVPNQTPQSTTPPPPRFKLIQTSTSLSAIPTTSDNTTTLLVHATNTFGTWGAGFAKALQTLYPSASKVYESWCNEHRPAPNEWPSRELVGRCLVVPPQEGDVDAGEVWIACLFTSYGYGGRAVRGGTAKGGGHAAKDGVEVVVESTRDALGELRRWVRGFEGGGDGGEEGEVSGNGGHGVDEAVGGGNNQKRTSKVVMYSPKFNSGNFGVDWEVTAGMIREILRDWDGEWRTLADR